MYALTERSEASMEQVQTGDSRPVAACADGALLISHLSGDPGAFARLVRSWSAPLFGFLTRLGVPGHSRAGAFEAIVLGLHRNAAEFAPTRPFKPWLLALAVAEARSRLSQPARHAAPTPLATEQSRAGFIETQLAALPLALREVALLCGVEQLSPSETAEVVGVSLIEVERRLRRARLALAHALVDRVETPREESP